jgi:hypothetical protein
MEKKLRHKEKLKKKEELTNAPAVVNPTPPVEFGMDGTSHALISFEGNQDYSTQIVKDTPTPSDFEKLLALRTQDGEKFLKEAEKTILKLWHSVESLTAHTDLFLVRFQIGMGQILNAVEDFFEKKSDYIRWFTERFGDRQRRYFQQAKELARMGKFAYDNSSLGKQRLLQFNRLLKKMEEEEETQEESESHEKILEKFPFLDTTMDQDGKLFSVHVDAVITLSRFRRAGIDYVEFDQAKLMACYGGEAVKVGVIEDLKAQLDLADDKEELLDRFVMDQMQLQEGHAAPAMGESLVKRLADLDEYLSKKKKQFDDPQYLEGLRSSNVAETLDRVHRVLGNLIKKMQLKRLLVKSDKEVSHEDS